MSCGWMPYGYLQTLANIGKHRGMFTNDVTARTVAKPMVPGTRSPVWPSRCRPRNLSDLYQERGRSPLPCQCGA